MRHRSKFRTTRDIVIPKGNPVVFVAHAKQEVYRLANSIVRLNPDMIYEWSMSFDDAVLAGLIEKVE